MRSYTLRRGWLWLPGVLVALLVAAPAPATAQMTTTPPKVDKKQLEKQRKETQVEVDALVKLIDASQKGQPTPSDFTISWHNDFMKAQQGRIYVPFTLSIDPAGLTTRNASMFIRVAARTPPAPSTPPEAAEKDAPKDKAAQAQPPLWPFEDIHLFEFKEPAKGQPYKVSRALAVPGGEYDVYIALHERKSGRNVVAKAAVLKQSLTVPDYWNGQLQTSSVILADSVQPRTSPASQEEAIEKPYLIGNTEITPAVDNKFTKAEELSVIFMIYNPGLKDKKPDVTVEYKFYQKATDGTEKYFNRTSPTVLNASSLPPQFDFDLGHQLVAGQSVPLASFPEGDYRLEIEVIDNLAQAKKMTRELLFTVAGS
jgi:hypothetical protein